MPVHAAMNVFHVNLARIIPLGEMKTLVFELLAALHEGPRY